MRRPACRRTSRCGSRTRRRRADLPLHEGHGTGGSGPTWTRWPPRVVPAGQPRRLNNVMLADRQSAPTARPRRYTQGEGRAIDGVERVGAEPGLARSGGICSSDPPASANSRSGVRRHIRKPRRSARRARRIGFDSADSRCGRSRCSGSGSDQQRAAGEPRRRARRARGRRLVVEYQEEHVDALDDIEGASRGIVHCDRSGAWNSPSRRASEVIDGALGDVEPDVRRHRVMSR